MIDWTKPLELMDGTPVRLKTYVSGATNPDSLGDYYLEREDGRCIPFPDNLLHEALFGSTTLIVRPDGRMWGIGDDRVVVRNREPSAAPKSLRDEFAMAALPTYLNKHPADRLTTRLIAEAAYAVADAMMAERELGS